MTDDAGLRAEMLPHREVMAMLAARLAPYAAPANVVRDAYTLALRHRSDFDPQRASLRNWLLAITADCAHAAGLRRGRGAAPPAHQRGDMAKRSALDAALDSLPERQRFAVDCVYFVGLSVEETAELLRVSARSVRSALVDAQRRIDALVEAGVAGDPPAEFLQSAGATWRADFREMPLPDPSTAGAPQRHPVDADPEPDEDEPGPVEVEPVEPEPEPEPEPGAGQGPEPDPRRRRTWLLPTVIGVVLLLVVGTLAVVRAVKAAEIAALEQQDRDLQLCGQVPPGLDRITVSRDGRSSGTDFGVRVSAQRAISVYAAQVTGVDATGRIATYVKRDVVTQNGAMVAVVLGPDQDLGTRSSVARDPCDGTTSAAAGLTEHLIVYAFGDGGSLVMDAGPVDQLAVSDG